MDQVTELEQVRATGFNSKAFPLPPDYSKDFLKDSVENIWGKQVPLPHALLNWKNFSHFIQSNFGIAKIIYRIQNSYYLNRYILVGEGLPDFLVKKRVKGFIVIKKHYC